MDFKAAIFDLDGTLLDSTNIWEQIDIDFLGKRGHPVPDDYIREISSRSFEEAAQYTIQRFSLSESPESLVKEWNNMAIQAYSHHICLKPGAKGYLEQLSRANLPLAVATSLPKELYLPVLQNNQILPYFSVIYSTDDVGKSKTSPDIFIHTASKLQSLPEHCLVFEDILVALESAKQAKMQTVGVYDEASKENWPQIQKIADTTLLNFFQAPLPSSAS